MRKFLNSLFIIHNSTQRGYIATSAVLVLMVVVLTIVTTVSLLSIGEAQGSLALTKGEEALSFVEGCVEDAILKTKASPTYNGGNITRPEGTCTVTVSKAGNVWTETISTTDTAYKRTVRVVFTRTSSITLTSWQEI